MKLDIEGWGIENKYVLAAFKAVPREKFVPEDLATSAYEDHPLPIGYNQTISQPYIVAYMTEQLLSGSENTLKKVLEIGTGSGYQAAILSHVADEVYTVETIEPLYQQATQRLESLGYTHVHVKYGDGYWGWEEHAPYDGIIVTAASPEIPSALIEQLALGGRMILPVGPADRIQYLVLVTKDQKGKVTTQKLIAVAFVPLVHEKDSS